MARKIINRKELRRAGEAAESAAAATKSPAEKKAAPKRKTRTKTPKEIRLKAFWGVYNQSMKCVAKFEYSDRKQADKKASDLSGTQKTPHFVQVLKETITE